MPVTAKLSQKFYQRLGDEIATELVEWFNAVDATYRSEVRAIADAQSARIDAQMGQLRAELRQEIGDLRAEMRVGFAAVSDRFATLEMGTDAKLERLKAELLRWMFLFWVGSVGAALLLKLL